MRQTPPTRPIEDLTRGVWRENPVFVQLLGLCPALAVTNTVENGLAMGVATAFVTVASGILISAGRRMIPHAIRITTYVLVVATFVTVTDMVMQATVPVIHKALGAYVYLIVVNCMILSRHEIFASKRPVLRSTLDALGTSAGFLLALVLMGAVREILGSGSLLGQRVTPVGMEPWAVMALPPGGFFTIGMILLAFNARELRTESQRSGRRSQIHAVATARRR